MDASIVYGFCTACCFIALWEEYMTPKDYAIISILSLFWPVVIVTAIFHKLTH